MPDWTYHPPETAPAALDIVWCRFPLVEDPNSPGPKERPALVRRALKISGYVYAEVTYGTSQTSKHGETDFFVASVQDLIPAGLPQMTIFQLDRTVTLPWAEEWFVKRSNTATPVIGHLSANSQEFLRYLVRRMKR